MKRESVPQLTGVNLIAWVATMPTPQFANILNELAADPQLDVRAFYRFADDKKHGWGELPVAHPFETMQLRRPIHNFIHGTRVGMNATLKAAVIFGYTSPFATGLLLTCRIRRIPVITMSDSDSAANARNGRTKRAVKQIFLRSVYPRSTRVWVIGKSNAEYWSAYGLNNQRYIPFESPIPRNGNILEQRDEIRSTTKRDDNDRIVLYVGRISPEKRVQDLVDALRILNRSADSRYRCLIVGLGDVDSLGIKPSDDFVRIMGALPHDRLGAAYSAADVLVVPSDREPYGLVVREALQFGLPVVATSRVPSALELCDKGWNIVPPIDPIALAAAVKRACDEERWPILHVVDTSKAYSEELARVVHREAATATTAVAGPTESGPSATLNHHGDGG